MLAQKSDDVRDKSVKSHCFYSMVFDLNFRNNSTVELLPQS